MDKNEIDDTRNLVLKEFQEMESLTPSETELKRLNSKINNEVKPILILIISISFSFFLSTITFSEKFKDAPNDWAICLVVFSIYIALATLLARCIIKKSIVTMWCTEKLESTPKMTIWNYEKEIKSYIKYFEESDPKNDRYKKIFYYLYYLSLLILMLNIFLYMINASFLCVISPLIMIIENMLHYIICDHFDNFIFSLLSVVYIFLFLNCNKIKHLIKCWKAHILSFWHSIMD